MSAGEAADASRPPCVFGCAVCDGDTVGAVGAVVVLMAVVVLCKMCACGPVERAARNAERLGSLHEICPDSPDVSLSYRRPSRLPNLNQMAMVVERKTSWRLAGLLELVWPFALGWHGLHAVMSTAQADGETEAFREPYQHEPATAWS